MGKHIESQKNSLKSNAASHKDASWCTDTDGILEHSAGGGSLHYKGPFLQKIIPVIFAPPYSALVRNNMDTDTQQSVYIK